MWLQVGREGWSLLGKGTIWMGGTKGKVIARAYACNKCSVWSSFQSLKRNICNQNLVALCLAFPLQASKRRHHWGKNRKMCQVVTSFGFCIMWSKGNLNVNCTFCLKAIGMQKYNQGMWNPNKKAPRGSKFDVATLALGSRPRQRLTRVWPKKKPMSHISCSWECRRVWGNEPSHSQMNSHFGSWSPNGPPNFQRAISGVKTH
jgi:hypothetical protein